MTGEAFICGVTRAAGGHRDGRLSEQAATFGAQAASDVQDVVIASGVANMSMAPILSGVTVAMKRAGCVRFIATSGLSQGQPIQIFHGMETRSAGWLARSPESRTETPQ